jgi:MtN3 and saliva related transmembrane protein
MLPPYVVVLSIRPSQMVEYAAMDKATLLGMMAGACTTISFLPQLIKTWKTKSTHDISIGMYVTLSIGLLLWALYGISIHSLPVIITNVVTLVLACTVLVLKIRHG